MCIFCDTSLPVHLRFKSFSDSNPRIYIPFVANLFLSMAISPGLKGDLRRRENLPQIVLKGLEVIVNVCLDIKLNLSLDIINEITSDIESNGVDKDKLEKYRPYLRIETYISRHAEKKLFLNNMYNQLFLHKTNDADDTEKLIPCIQYVKTNPDLVGQMFWGPPYWIVLHFCSLKLDLVEEVGRTSDDEFKTYVERFACIFGVLDLLLPCGICAEHYNSEFQEDDDVVVRPLTVSAPIQIILNSIIRHSFEYTCILHWACKPATTAEDNNRSIILKYKERFSKFLN
jgi:hypothetical protein